MTLQVTEIRSLLRRATRSLLRGYQIALGDQYAQALGGSDGSPAGLVALCEKALADTAEPVAPSAPVDAEPAGDAPPTLRPPAPISMQPPPPEEQPSSAGEVPALAAADDASSEEDDDAEAEETVEQEVTEGAKDPATTQKARRRRRK